MDLLERHLACLSCSALQALGASQLARRLTIPDLVIHDVITEAVSACAYKDCVSVPFLGALQTQGNLLHRQNNAACLSYTP